MSNTVKLLYPDALYDINSISCATFLYFDKGQIGITLHPTVSMFLSGCDPYDFLKFIEQKRPIWLPSYISLYNLWVNSNSHVTHSYKLLQTLHDLNYYKSILLAYAKTETVLNKAEEYVSTLGIPYEELIKYINIEQAAQELMAHLHFEKIIELYGSPSGIPTNGFKKREVDYQVLYDYCNHFFTKTTFEQALVHAYFFRLMSVNDFNNFMLSNERLIPLLNKLPNIKEVEEASQVVKTEDMLDLVSWEIFRQIVSPYLDEKDSGIRISNTIDLLQMRNDEIIRLKNKCILLAEDINADYSLPSFQQNVSKYVSLHVEKDVQDLLTLDKNAFREVRDKIFSDEKTWFALLTFITSLFTGGEFITAAAGLASLSNIFAKTFETKSSINKAVSKNDYSLLYRIKKL